MEQGCDQTNTNDDHDASDHAPEEGHCIVHAEYIFQQTDTAVRIKQVNSFSSDDNLFNYDLYVANLVELVLLEPDKKPDYGEYTSSFLITKPYPIRVACTSLYPFLRILFLNNTPFDAVTVSNPIILLKTFIFISTYEENYNSNLSGCNIITTVL